MHFSLSSLRPTCQKQRVLILRFPKGEAIGSGLNWQSYLGPAIRSHNDETGYNCEHMTGDKLTDGDRTHCVCLRTVWKCLFLRVGGLGKAVRL